MKKFLRYRTSRTNLSSFAIETSPQIDNSIFGTKMVTLTPTICDENTRCDMCGNSSTMTNGTEDNNPILEIVSERRKLTFLTPEETYSTTIPFDRYTTNFRLQLKEDGIKVEKKESEDVIEYSFKFGSIVITRE